MVLAIGYAYVRFGGMPWMQAVFYGVGSAVIGIMAMSSYRLTKKTIGNDWLFWIIFLTLVVVTFLTEAENIWLILAAGIMAWFVKSPPKFFSTHQETLFPFFLQISDQNLFDHKMIQMSLFFLKAGAFIFGSGLAIIPFLYGGLVKEHQWLTEQQFLDAVAVAMITPGPVVITVGFIGYLIGGFEGAVLAALATFLPCYLFTIIPAPYFKKYGKHPGIKAFIDGVTAAAIGAIAGAVFVLGKRQLNDIPSALICLVVILILFFFKKIQDPLIIFVSAILGLILKALI